MNSYGKEIFFWYAGIRRRRDIRRRSSPQPPQLGNPTPPVVRMRVSLHLELSRLFGVIQAADKETKRGSVPYRRRLGYQSQKSASRGWRRPTSMSGHQPTSDDTESSLRYRATDRPTNSRRRCVITVLQPVTRRLSRWYTMQADRLSDFFHSRVFPPFFSQRYVL